MSQLMEDVLDSLSERLEALTLKLPTERVSVFAAWSSRGRSRTYHFSKVCKKFRASRYQELLFTTSHVQALCPTCVSAFAADAGTTVEQRNLAALTFASSAVSALGRANLHVSDDDVSTSDVWAGRALRASEIAAGLGVSDVSSIASDVVRAARELTKTSAVSTEEFAAAELAAAFLSVSKQFAASKEQARVVGGDGSIERFALSQMRRLLEGPSREEFLAAAVKDAHIFFGEVPQWAHQLPDRPFPVEGVVSVREWALSCWREVRDETALELASRWYDQGALALAAAPRRSLIFARVSTHGNLGLLAQAVGALRYPDRNVLVFEDVADTTVVALKSLAERETLVAVTDRVDASVLEIAVGLYDPRSSGRLAKLAGALNAAKAC